MHFECGIPDRQALQLDQASQLAELCWACLKARATYEASGYLLKSRYRWGPYNLTMFNNVFELNLSELDVKYVPSFFWEAPLVLVRSKRERHLLLFLHDESPRLRTEI